MPLPSGVSWWMNCMKKRMRPGQCSDTVGSEEKDPAHKYNLCHLFPHAVFQNNNNYYYSHLTALFPGQPE